MGCRYEWADDNHIIMNVYIEAPWTWEEYNGMLHEMFGQLRNTGKPCANAVDVTRMGRLPRGNALMYLGTVEKQMPANVFASALVGAPYILATFMDIIIRARPRAKMIALFAKTMPEAHAKIMDRYAKISTSANVELS
jgi:hypothetical protein